ncbi:SDR family oxidoreductase [Nocardia vinacea]|uniref:SDR family oxidoreductase n=1 Tax=Nocardia vinacea TaxID=96468 RepID=UPI0002E1C6B5|nr:SDR family NAD(P)-dependent oxidoreductase [Nocardia vinacea]
MPTIAIVGAGPGLGLSIAKTFGRNGFRVALIARTQAKLDELAAELGGLDIEAQGFAADLMDRASLVEAFAGIKKVYGDVDVLEYSPAPHNPVRGITMVGPLEVTVENLQPQIDFYLHGAVTAVEQVLPAMIERGSGTLLFTTGASSTVPMPIMGNVGPAGAALRNWVLNLNQVLAEKGVYVAHVPLSVWMGSGGPETQPDTIAQLYWDLYTAREEAEHPYVVPQ